LAYYWVDRLDEVISDYTRAIELNPNKVEFYDNRAESYNENRQYVEAISDCTKAIELNLNPKKESLYYLGRAYNYERNGQRDLAIKDFEYVLSLDPKCEWASHGLEKIKAPER
jgi:tetratricopeptide (TPR) repeat protein